MPPDETWDSYQRLVLDKLDQSERDLQRLSEQLADLRVELASIRIKAGLLGAIAGAAPALAVAVMWWLK